MTSHNNLILNRLFTQNTLHNLLEENDEEIYAKIVRSYIDDPYSKKNSEIITEIYGYISKNYRNEYFYKNTILNKLLLGVHSPRTTTALTEVPISKSKADFILINGKAVVYEIKTGLDTFDRLETQLYDYYKAFNHVCVVTCESNFDSVLERLKGSCVGIYTLTNNNKISKTKFKIPTENNDYIDPTVIFKILNKSEFESIILNYYNFLPDVTPVNYYRACLRLFTKIDIKVSYELFLKELKKRNRINLIEYDRVPYELKFLVYFSKLREIEYKQLNWFLNQKFGG